METTLDSGAAAGTRPDAACALPASTRAQAGDFEPPAVLWGPDNLTAAAGPPVPWLWHGFLRPGAVTLLTSEWKSGKTTLASVLLARLGSGGALAGLALGRGRAIIVTEEDPSLWQGRAQALGIGAHVGWCCRPFRGRPSLKTWQCFIDYLVELHERDPLALVIIDPLAAFLPGSENSAGAIMDVFLPLQRLTARRVSVFVQHHPSKGDPLIGQAARGTGALCGFVDIYIEMRYFDRADDEDRRRRLWTFSRFPESPSRLVIEWSADGTDYLSHGTFEDEEFGRQWRRLHAICADAPQKLTRLQIQERWQSRRKPDRITLKRWLEQAVSRGLLRRDGKGLRSSPFRYWLPEKEEAWRQDEWACHLMPELMQQTGEAGQASYGGADSSGGGEPSLQSQV